MRKQLESVTVAKLSPPTGPIELHIGSRDIQLPPLQGEEPEITAKITLNRGDTMAKYKERIRRMRSASPPPLPTIEDARQASIAADKALQNALDLANARNAVKAKMQLKLNDFQLLNGYTFSL